MAGAKKIKLGFAQATKEEIANAGAPAGQTILPDETPDGEPQRDPEVEDDGEESGPEAPVDNSPLIHSFAASRHPTHTRLTVRFFNDGEGWVTRHCTIAHEATAQMMAHALANIRSWA